MAVLQKYSSGRGLSSESRSKGNVFSQCCNTSCGGNLVVSLTGARLSSSMEDF